MSQTTLPAIAGVLALSVVLEGQDLDTIVRQADMRRREYVEGFKNLTATETRVTDSTRTALSNDSGGSFQTFSSINPISRPTKSASTGSPTKWTARGATVNPLPTFRPDRRDDHAFVVMGRDRVNDRDAVIVGCRSKEFRPVEATELPFKIVQTPRLIIFLYEQDTTFRQVFLDGRPLPADPQPSWLGYSVGHWDGDELVVDTIGFQDRGWLDGLGHPYSDALRMTERFRRLNVGRLDIHVIYNDLKTYSKPIEFTQPHNLLADSDLIEFFCTENERARPHMTGK